MQIRLLIVDDEQDFVETLVNRFTKRNFDVVGVNSGEQALEAMQNKYYDVVVLDIKMPGGMDGIETLREIKRLQPLAEVILLTGHGTVETSIEGMKLGAFDYILKPAKFEGLFEKIAEAYQRKQKQDEKIRKANVQELTRFPGRVLKQDPK